MISPINGNHAEFQMLQSMAQPVGQPAAHHSRACQEYLCDLSQSSALQCRLDGEMHDVTFSLAVLQTGQDGAVDSNSVTSLNANLV